MSRRRHTPGGYHHGNLREALLDAARQLIEEKGPDGFTLAEAARVAGVSPAAPYRHFKDRSEILGALAVAGFEQFADELESAWEHGRPDVITAFTRVGRAYLTFARTEPAAYTVMFESGVSAKDTPGFPTASGRAFDVLRTCTAALLERVSERSRPPVDLMSMHIWSLTHGTATLFAQGNAGRGRIPMESGDVLESAILVYLRGLGIIPHDDT